MPTTTPLANGTRVVIDAPAVHPDLYASQYDGATGVVAGWMGRETVVRMDDGGVVVFFDRSDVRVV